MDGQAEQLDVILQQGAGTLAGFTAVQLSEEEPATLAAFSPLPFESWRGYLQSRIVELASAVRAKKPRLFASHIDWCRAILASRGISDTVLIPALRALENVLIETYPVCKAELDPYFAASMSVFDHPLADSHSLLDVSTSNGRLAAEYVLATLEGDRRAACNVVLNAVNGGLDVRHAYLHVLAPAIQEIGRMWHRNEVSIAEEHFVTATTQMVMSQLQAKAIIAEPIGKTVVAAAVSGNRHEIGIRVVADFFEMAGWRTIFLGADLPGSDIAQAVIDFEADLVVLAATLTSHLAAVSNTITAIRSKVPTPSMKIVVGGSAFADSPSLATDAGADAFAETPDEAVHVGTQLINL